MPPHTFPKFGAGGFDTVWGATGPTGAAGTTGMGVTGPTGPTGVTGASGPFLSCYAEALASDQELAGMEDFVFDVDPAVIDIIGSGIELDATGSVFTISRAGLYHVEWSVNILSGTAPVILCLIENGEPVSPLHQSALTGNCSSGALINIEEADLPYTISLRNYGGPIVVADAEGFDDTAASIRLLRFADGPS